MSRHAPGRTARTDTQMDPATCGWQNRGVFVRHPMHRPIPLAVLFAAAAIVGALWTPLELTGGPDLVWAAHTDVEISERDCGDIVAPLTAGVPLPHTDVPGLRLPVHVPAPVSCGRERHTVLLI